MIVYYELCMSDPDLLSRCAMNRMGPRTNPCWTPDLTFYFIISQVPLVRLERMESLVLKVNLVVSQNKEQQEILECWEIKVSVSNINKDKCALNCDIDFYLYSNFQIYNKNAMVIN